MDATRSTFGWLRRASEWSWRILMVAAAVALVVLALIKLWFVVLPVFVALLLTSALVPVATRLERRNLRPLPAAWATFGGFLVVVAAVVALIAPAVASEFSGLGDVLSEGVDDVEGWLVEGPLDLEPERLERYRQEAGTRIGEILRNSSGSLVAGAVAVFEGLAGMVLALVLTFF
ncbi:MAG: AI-2E family transporter, partial [Acidimicrobiia bacterium]